MMLLAKLHGILSILQGLSPTNLCCALSLFTMREDASKQHLKEKSVFSFVYSWHISLLRASILGSQKVMIFVLQTHPWLNHHVVASCTKHPVFWQPSATKQTKPLNKFLTWNESMPFAFSFAHRVKTPSSCRNNFEGSVSVANHSSCHDDPMHFLHNHLLCDEPVLFILLWQLHRQAWPCSVHRISAAFQHLLTRIHSQG